MRDNSEEKIKVYIMISRYYDDGKIRYVIAEQNVAVDKNYITKETSNDEYDEYYDVIFSEKVLINRMLALKEEGAIFELSKYENDKMSPSINTLEKILKAMGYKLLINVGENDEWRKIIRVEACF